MSNSYVFRMLSYLLVCVPFLGPFVCAYYARQELRRQARDHGLEWGGYEWRRSTDVLWGWAIMGFVVLCLNVGFVLVGASAGAPEVVAVGQVKEVLHEAPEVSIQYHCDDAGGVFVSMAALELE